MTWFIVAEAPLFVSDEIALRAVQAQFSGLGACRGFWRFPVQPELSDRFTWADRGRRLAANMHAAATPGEKPNISDPASLDIQWLETGRLE